MWRKIIINIWDKYWKLTILKEIEVFIWNDNKKIRQFLCSCECWNTKKVKMNILRKWDVKSCWCLYKWKKVKNTKWTRFYKIWYWLKHRCNNKKNSRYWWRWIWYESRWEKFQYFKEDMYKSYLDHVEKFWEKETTIDRINVDWDYCKNNCKWATLKEQQRNTTKNIIYNWKCVSEWCEKLWLDRNTVQIKISKWFSIEKALNLV